MCVTGVMLAVALGSTGYYDHQFEWPAMCLLTHNFENLEGEFDKWLFRDYEYNSLYMVIILCFLILSYVSRVVQLFPSIQPNMRNWFRSRPSNAIGNCMTSLKDRATASSRKATSKFWTLAHGLLMSFYCLSEAVADLYGSLLWEVRMERTLLIAYAITDHAQDHMVSLNINMGNNRGLAAPWTSQLYGRLRQYRKARSF